MDPKKVDEVVNQPPQPNQPQPSQPVVTTPGKEPIPPTIQSFLTQPQAQQPVQAKHSHHFFRWMLVTLIIILLVIAGALGYFIFMKPQASISTDTQSPLPTIPAEVTQPVQEVTPMEDEMTTPVSVTPEAMPSTTSPSSQSAQ